MSFMELFEVPAQAMLQLRSHNNSNNINNFSEKKPCMQVDCFYLGLKKKHICIYVYTSMYVYKVARITKVSIVVEITSIKAGVSTF